MARRKRPMFRRQGGRSGQDLQATTTMWTANKAGLITTSAGGISTTVLAQVPPTPAASDFMTPQKVVLSGLTGHIILVPNTRTANESDLCIYGFAISVGKLSATPQFSDLPDPLLINDVNRDSPKDYLWVERGGLAVASSTIPTANLGPFPSRTIKVRVPTFTLQQGEYLGLTASALGPAGAGMVGFTWGLWLTVSPRRLT